MADRLYPFMPYCGLPPTPADIWNHWNLNPILWTALIAVLAVYVGFGQVAQRGRTLPWWRQIAFVTGWALCLLILTSPLCALSVSLFAARASQHMALSLLAAPLVALGLPTERPPRWPVAGAVCFAVIFWFWHAPAPYVATFKTDLAYWTMHLTTFAAATWFWGAVIGATTGRPAVAIGAVLFSSLQMAFLGAILTFAPAPLYAPHLWSAPRWGLTALADQQLGGVIMWGPAGLVFVVAVIVPVAVTLRKTPASPLHLAHSR